jgi:hypothetical protein
MRNLSLAHPRCSFFSRARSMMGVGHGKLRLDPASRTAGNAGSPSTRWRSRWPGYCYGFGGLFSAVIADRDLDSNSRRNLSGGWLLLAYGTKFIGH